MYDVTIYDLTGRPMPALRVAAVLYNDGGALLSTDGKTYDAFYPYHRIVDILKLRPQAVPVGGFGPEDSHVGGGP